MTDLTMTFDDNDQAMLVAALTGLLFESDDYPLRAEAKKVLNRIIDHYRASEERAR